MLRQKSNNNIKFDCIHMHMHTVHVCTVVPTSLHIVWPKFCFFPQFVTDAGLFEHLAVCRQTLAVCHCISLIPYSGKFSRDKSFADDSKNEYSCIKFRRCWPQSLDRTTKTPNSQLKFSQMFGQPQNLRKFCSVKIPTIRCLAINYNQMNTSYGYY